jgi:hypothetical protein
VTFLNHKKRAWYHCIGFIFILLLFGCDESTEVILHEPGVYKGKVDKHDLTQAQRDEILRKRIMAVQTDR